MAYITRVFRCDDCGMEVSELMDRDDTNVPSCPRCEAEGQMTGPIPSTTAIGERTASKSVDAMWKSVQEGGEIRAEALGDNSMKVTDMADGFYGGGLKEGDSTAPKMPVNGVTQYAQATGFNGGSFWGKNGTGGGGATLEQHLSKVKGGGQKSVGMETISNVIQGGGGPLSFPTRVRPAE